MKCIHLIIPHCIETFVQTFLDSSIHAVHFLSILSTEHHNHLYVLIHIYIFNKTHFISTDAIQIFSCISLKNLL